MDHSISLPSDPILWGKAQALNEKTVARVGFLVFFLVVVGSIVIRLRIEASAPHKVNSARPAVATERSLVKVDILVPVTLSIKFENGKATLRGTLPDEKSHDTVVNRAREIYGLSNVDDHLGAEPEIVLTLRFDSVLKWFPPRIEQIQSGEISVNGMNVLLFGQAPDISAQIAVGRALTKLAGPGGRVLNDLQVVSVDSMPPAALGRKQWSRSRYKPLSV